MNNKFVPNELRQIVLGCIPLNKNRKVSKLKLTIIYFLGEGKTINWEILHSHITPMLENTLPNV